MTAQAMVLSPQEQRIARGQSLGLTTDDARHRRAHIHARLQGFRDTPVKLSVERARLNMDGSRRLISSL